MLWNRPPPKCVLQKGPNELLNDKMYKLGESQDFTLGLFRHLIKSSTLAVPVTHFVKQQSERDIVSKAKFGQDNIWETIVKEKFTSPLPLTSHSPETSKTSKTSKIKQRRTNIILITIPSLQLALSASQADI